MDERPDCLAPPQGVHVFVRDVEIPHRLVYEGVVEGCHHWMLHVAIDEIPYPQDLKLEIAVFPARSSIELFWELP